MEEREGLTVPETVELNIRSPVSSLEDLRIVCPLEWRVSRVKEKISELFPGNPPPKGQKLVYAGKLLEDQERLQEFIRFQDECSIYTIHLVCKMLQSNSNESQLRRRKPEQSIPTTEETTQGANHINSWAQYLQFSNQMQFSEDNMQQMAAMQEMYTQYLSQYMQYMQTGAPVPQPDIQGVRNEGEREGARAPIVMNAGAGAGGQAFQEEEEPAGNRDMLDWLYISVRILILLSVVYFYSSFSRFALVAIIFLVLYSFQVGFWQGDNRDRDNIQQEVNNIRDPQQPSQEDLAAAPQQQQPSLLNVVSTFLATFFTSIIPEQNQVV